jgi:hypothetical protein
MMLGLTRIVSALALLGAVLGQGNPVKIMALGDSITGSPVSFLLLLPLLGFETTLTCPPRAAGALSSGNASKLPR